LKSPLSTLSQQTLLFSLHNIFGLCHMTLYIQIAPFAFEKLTEFKASLEETCSLISIILKNFILYKSLDFSLTYLLYLFCHFFRNLYSCGVHFKIFVVVEILLISAACVCSITISFVLDIKLTAPSCILYVRELLYLLPPLASCM